MKITLRILLGVAIVVLGYLCVMSIVTPIKFEESQNEREKVIIKTLIDVRKAEIAYKDQKGKYTNNPDSLVDFIKNGQVAIILKEGTLTDEQLKNGLTEKKAMAIINKGNQKEIIANGLENFRRDTSYISVYESLFAQDYPYDQLEQIVVIPFSGGKKFEFDTRMFTNEASGITIPLFEARAPYDAYLNDLNRQELINLKDKRTKLNKYVGLKVGSVDEPNNNAGNWE